MYSFFNIPSKVFQSFQDNNRAQHMTEILQALQLGRLQPGRAVIKLFSCSTQLSMKFSLLIKMKMPTIVGIFIFISRENCWHFRIHLQRKFHAQPCLARKKKTIVSTGNLRFISSTNFMLSWAEHEKRFTTSGPDVKGPGYCALAHFLPFFKGRKSFAFCAASYVWKQVSPKIVTKESKCHLVV